MKYVSKQNRWIKEDLNFYYSKLQIYLKCYTTFDKEKRKRRKENYNHIFRDVNSFRDKYNYSVPEGKFYKPVGMIATELVPKEKMHQLKLGMKKLIINHTSHKFLGGFTSLDEIINGLDRLDDTFSSWHTYIDCGRFDFSNIKELDEVVDYYDLKLRNFNSSYIAVEVQIYYAQEKVDKLSSLIDNDYKNIRGFITEYLSYNSKGSGAKKSKTLSHYNNAHIKSELINDCLIDIKWNTFKQLNDYIPLMLIEKGIIPPSVNIFNTNIMPDEKNMNRFFSSVGIDEYKGQFINDKDKLFFSTQITTKVYSKHEMTDMILLVNEDRYTEINGYYSFNFYIMKFFEEVYEDLYKCYLANILFDEFAKECVKHKVLNDKIKIKKRNLKRMLLLRNKFEVDMTWYKRFVNETDWNKEIEKVNKHFDKKNMRWGIDQSALTGIAFIGHNKLKLAINEIEKSIDLKIEVIKHINEYNQVKKSYLINVVMLAISLFTLYLIINPQNAVEINKKLSIIIKQIQIFLEHFTR